MHKQISSSLCDMRSEPKMRAILETQLLFGEQVIILKKLSNWFYCKAKNDGYLGWIMDKNLVDCTSYTHVVSSLICHCYEEDNIKSRVVKNLYLNSKVKIIKKKGDWRICKIDNKIVYIYKKHLIERNKISSNWLNYALFFEKVPYLWGGKSALGIDCSGLVQVCLNLAGYKFPRNTNDQIFYLKNKSEKIIQKGCLIFWDKHVAIALDKKRIIHSNAYHLCVEIEDFTEAKKRIKKTYGEIIAIKKVDNLFF